MKIVDFNKRLIKREQMYGNHSYFPLFSVLTLVEFMYIINILWIGVRFSICLEGEYFKIKFFHQMIQTPDDFG